MLTLSLLHWPFIGKRKKTLGVGFATGLAVITFIISGSTYNPFAKELTNALSPLSLLFISELLTVFFVLMSYGFFPIVKEVRRLKRKQLIALLFVGITSGTIAPILWFFGLHSTSAVNASLFGNAEMVFLILFAVLFLKEKWTALHVTAGFTIALGVVTITLQGFSEQISLQGGDLLILLASFTFSIGSILFRVYLQKISVHIAIIARSMVAIATFFLLSPLMEKPLIEELRLFPLIYLPALLGFAFLARFLNVTMFYVALDRLSVSIVSLLGTLHVIGGAVFSHFYLGEALLWYHYMGGALIICGTLLLELRGLFKAEKHLFSHLVQKLHHRI